MLHRKGIIPSIEIAKEKIICNLKHFGNFIVFQNKKSGNTMIHCIGEYNVKDAIDARDYADALLEYCPQR